MERGEESKKTFQVEDDAVSIRSGAVRGLRISKSLGLINLIKKARMTMTRSPLISSPNIKTGRQFAAVSSDGPAMEEAVAQVASCEV